jgi:hypothetical protein
MTHRAESDQLLLVIITRVAAELLVVNFQIRHRAARLTAPIITGLHAADRCAADQMPDGIFLVRVASAYFRRQAQKPYYTIGLANTVKRDLYRGDRSVAKGSGQRCEREQR